MEYIREKRNEKTGDETKADRASDEEIARRPKSGTLTEIKKMNYPLFYSPRRLLAWLVNYGFPLGYLRQVCKTNFLPKVGKSC